MMTGDIERIREALHFIPTSDRNTWVKMGMAVKSELGDAGVDVWEEWSQQDESFDTKAARDVWKSIRTNGKVTAGTLFHEAKTHGWRDDGKHPKPTPEEIGERLRTAADRAAREEADIARERAAAVSKAAAIWKEAAPAPADHAYLVRKGIGANGVRLHKDALLIPLRADGDIHSLQFIDSNGDKRFLTGGRVAGCYFSIGKPDGVLCIAEGFATGASIHEATGYAVAVAFNAGNLLPAAKALRDKFPTLTLVLCADDDVATHGNPGLAKAAEAAQAVGGIVALPDFGTARPDSATDFNDMAKICGAEAVGRTIAKAIALVRDEHHQTQETAPKGLVVIGIHDLLTIELPPREVILGPWLLSQSLNMVYAWRGIGKTHVALGIAYAVSSAGKFLCWEAQTPCKVLYLDGEMPGPALQSRLAAIAAAAEKEPEPGFLNIVTPDLQTGAMPDLGTWSGQEAINAVIETTGTELIIVDNLSCLVRSGGRENDAESWLMVAEWALAMRAQGKSVLFIHHAAKGGQQRGTSKREDLLDTVICLKRPPDYCPTDGAVFEVHYEKSRNLAGDDTNPIEAKLTTDEYGAQVWTWRTLEDSTLDRVVELANEGLSQREIADELEVNKSTVSRAWRKADALGLLTKKNSSKGMNQHHSKGAKDD